MLSETLVFNSRTWQVDLICHGVGVTLELKPLTHRVHFFLENKFKIHDMDLSLLAKGSKELLQMANTATNDELREKFKGLYSFSKVFEAYDEEGFKNLCELVFLFLTERSKEYLFKIPVKPWRDHNGVLQTDNLNGYQRLERLILDDEDYGQAMINRANLVHALSQALQGSFDSEKKNPPLLKRVLVGIKKSFHGRKSLTL